MPQLEEDRFLEVINDAKENLTGLVTPQTLVEFIESAIPEPIYCSGLGCLAIDDAIVETFGDKFEDVVIESLIEKRSLHPVAFLNQPRFASRCTPGENHENRVECQ